MAVGIVVQIQRAVFHGEFALSADGLAIRVISIGESCQLGGIWAGAPDGERSPRHRMDWA